MSNKNVMRSYLLSMGFTGNYIDRAFRVYEKNYACMHSYNVEVITEIIIRLQNKDNAKKRDRDSNSNTHKFNTTHLTLTEAKNLKIGDTVDHRDQVGRYVFGNIVEKSGTNLKIHYKGWSRKWDEWCDYSTELNGLAKPKTISKRPAHRFKDLRKGDYIDVNPIARHPGWTRGEIHRLDKHSGQVQVVYENTVDHQHYLYWAHLDNKHEIATFTGKTGRYPKSADEIINNPYKINDKLCIKHTKQNRWFNGTVIHVENNWIRVTLDGYDSKFENSFHLIRDRQLLNLIWYKELSFQNLKAKGILNCYNEWRTVKDSFGMNTKLAMEWLNKQKHFKQSRLSYVLIYGYAKTANIPADIQRLIASFYNFMFVKLVYGANDELFMFDKLIYCPNDKLKYRALDTNITIRDLAKILEIENNLDPKRKQYICSDYVHLFVRFGLIKEIYPIKTNKMEVKWESLMNEDAQRWVEVPDDYTELSLAQLCHSITYDQVLEIGVGFVTTGSNPTCSFNPNTSRDNIKYHKQWVLNLKIGDIVDVFNHRDHEWCSAMIRYISKDHEYIYIHYIGYHVKYDEIMYTFDNLSAIRKYSHFIVPYRSKKLQNQKVNKIMFCWRTD